MQLLIGRSGYDLFSVVTEILPFMHPGSLLNYGKYRLCFLTLINLIPTLLAIREFHFELFSFYTDRPALLCASQRLL